MPLSFSRTHQLTLSVCPVHCLGLVYSHFKSYHYMLYVSGACFIAAGLVMTPVHKATVHLATAYKALNRFYFHRRS